MPITYMLGLTNSRALNKIIQFDGLGLKMTIVPSVETLGEPIATKQVFYFLDGIEAVAKTRLGPESIFLEWLDEEHHRQAVMEYILDNYLFSYSIANDESRMTSKVKRDPFLSPEHRNRYVLGDRANAEYLAVDTLNDESILSCTDTIDPDRSFESDWLLFNNYFIDIYDRCVQEAESVFDRKVTLKAKSDSSIIEETLPIAKFRKRPYKYEELEQIGHTGYVDGDDNHLRAGFYEYSPELKIPMRHMSVKDFHNKYLLDIYFAALREQSHTVQFKHLYNVLEYLFEDATLAECKKHLPNEIAELVTDLSDWKNWRNRLDGSFRYNRRRLATEETQLKIVMNLFISKVEFGEKIEELDVEIKDQLFKPLTLNKAITIPALDLNDDKILDKYSERIYSVRNGIIHTKRTRFGGTPFTILPFSEAELFLQREIPLLRFVAQKVIQKEKDIFYFTALSFSPFEVLLLLELLFENRNYESLIKNLGLFLLDLSSKDMDEPDHEKFLGEILRILLGVIDNVRLDGSIPLGNIRDELCRIDIASFNETTQLVMKSIILLLQRNVDDFQELVRKIPRISMRANLYRLQNSLESWLCRTCKDCMD